MIERSDTGQQQHEEATPLEGHSLAALRLLATDPQQSQREVASALGMSLGRANFVLRALLERGFVKVSNFRQSNNKLAYAYVLTPSGFTEKLRLTRRFIHRKEHEFEELRQAITELKNELNKGAEATGRENIE